MRGRQDLDERTMVVNQPVFNASGKWKPFAFDRLEKVSRAQALLTQKLDWLLPSTAGNGQVNEVVLKRLKEIFEQDVQLVLDYVHVLRPKDLAKYAVDPTFLAVLAPAPHKTRGFLEVELGLAHAAIDQLLGVEGETVSLRPLSDIEEGVMTFVVLEAIKALSPTIEPGLPRLRLEGLVHGVDEAFGLLGEESQVVVVQFKVVLGPHSGFMRLFLPATLVGMAHPLEEGPQRRARRAAAVAKHLKRLAGVKTWLRAEIGRCELSTRELAELGGGDVVLAEEISARPDKNEGGKAKLRVGLGRVGRLDADVALDGGRWSAKITGFEFGGAPRDSREPSEHEEEAADSLAEQQAGQVDAPADSEQDASEVEESTSPGEKAVDDTLKEGSELLNDIPLQVSVELARIPVTAEEVVSLKIGQVLDLNRVPGEPVDLSVNGKVVARGELVEVEGHLGVRVLSLAG